MKPLLKYKFPLVLGTDFAGKVIQVGARVTRFKAGDEVYGSLDARQMGAFSEYVAVADEYISLKPQNLDFDQAASLPLVALTVAQAFTDIAKVTAGQKVLIKAGSGGIGSFAIQYAKALGAEVATTTSAENSDMVRKLSADHIIDYRSQKFENILSNYDAVLNTVDGESLEASFSVLKKGGHMISLVGPPDKKFAQNLGLNFIFQAICGFLGRKATSLAKKTKTHYTFHFVKPSGKQLEDVKSLVEAGKIVPVIDRAFSMNQTKEALSYVARGRSKGKVILKIKENTSEKTR
ncbi:Phenolphthiocerol synthesis polyketide synthase type I Pks15/1 [compost metagenome]